MKSFFKKVALVLALAMVVAMVPAKAVSAADAPQMRKTMKLYIDGDFTETYSDTANAWVKYDKTAYTVAFASDNEEVATVGAKKGGVTAKGVGEANVTATFTDKNGKVAATLTCKVTVKRNAVDAGIGDGSAAKLEEGLAVGESFQPKVFRTDSDGVASWKGKDAITDSARFVSTDTEVFTVSKLTGKVTAVGVGEAKLQVWAVQSEGAKKDADGKVEEYQATTTVREYTVKVIGGGLASAKQVSYNTVAITCDSAEVAEEIAKDVTKLKSVYALGENEIVAPIKSAAVDSNDNKVVNVTLFSNLLKDTTYKFTYGDDEAVTVVGADLGAIASVKIVTTRVEVGKTVNIGVKFYDQAGIEVPQGGNVLYFRADDSVDYVLTSNGTITFWEVGKQATVTAVYSMGYDASGNALPDLTDTAVIISGASANVGDILGWGVGNVGSKASDAGFSTGAIVLAANDNSGKDENNHDIPGKQLFIKFKNTEFDGTVNDKFNTSNDLGQVTGDTYEYASTNDNVVMVDTATGVIYPVAAGNAQIIVSKVVGSNKVTVCVVSINVAANRTLTTFQTELDRTKLSADGGDSITLKLTAKDQLGDTFVLDSSNVELDVVSVRKDGDVEYTIADIVVDGGGFSKLALKTSIEDTAPYTVQIKVTAKDTAHNVSQSRVISFQVKKSGAHATHVLEVGNDKIDMNFAALQGWEDLGKYNSSIALKSYDSQGYLREVIELTNLSTELNTAVNTTNAGVEVGYYFTVSRGSTNVADNVDGQTFKAVTGASESVSKIQTGTYTVRVYHVAETGKIAKLIGIKNIVVSDTTPVVVATVNNNKLTSAEAQSVVDGYAMPDGKLTFKRNGGDVTVEITASAATANLGSDNTIKTVFVKEVTVKETYHGKFSYVYRVNVGRTFYVAD